VLVRKATLIGARVTLMGYAKNFHRHLTSVAQCFDSGPLEPPSRPLLLGAHEQGLALMCGTLDGISVNSPAPPPTPGPSRRHSQLTLHQAQRLLDEGWEPYPFAVGAITRRGIRRPTGNVQEPIWQAMRQILERKTRD
jgi:hypothetical protein